MSSMLNYRITGTTLQCHSVLKIKSWTPLECFVSNVGEKHCSSVLFQLFSNSFRYPEKTCSVCSLSDATKSITILIHFPSTIRTEHLRHRHRFRRERRNIVHLSNGEGIDMTQSLRGPVLLAASERFQFSTLMEPGELLDMKSAAPTPT